LIASLNAQIASLTGAMNNLNITGLQGQLAAILANKQ